MDFSSWWGQQTPQLKTLIMSISDLKIGYDAGHNVSQIYIKQLEREVRELNCELECERMRLAACGIIALSNTPESAANARQMQDKYRSGSCDDVARAVDCEMKLRAEVTELRAKVLEQEETIATDRRITANTLCQDFADVAQPKEGE